MRDEAFAELDPAVLEPLMERRDGPGLRRLSVQLALLALTGWWLVVVPSDGPLAVALLVHAAVQASFFGPLHEAIHRTAFKTRALNTLTSWVAGFVQFSPPAGFRAFHFGHHRHTHDLESDPELGGVPLLQQWPRGPLLVVNATGLPILLGRVMWMVFSAIGVWPRALWEKVMPFVAENKQSAVARDSRLMVLAHVAFIALAVTTAPALLRVYAAAWLSHALLSMYLVAEHRGLPEQGDVLARTRSFAGNPVLDYALWNMPYHAEHHGWPAVPFHALPALHEAVADRLPHRTGLLHLYLHQGED